ncbi:hypothetical protein [Nostoc sp. MS1]|uniref:nucleotide-binding protein n=1 Tax=Nostoc sp. MS1 TaxID=2764711 RepID=UPI001CC4972C|nr:hypothetical protein [Nostoc sp. MS1]BCL40164.1 hypothetical protein NSMS1_66110 [Nostoc sp. MS1]
MTTIHPLPDNNQNTGNTATENTPINTKPDAPGAENIASNNSAEQNASDIKPNAGASDNVSTNNLTGKTTESTKPNNPASTGNNENDDENTNPEQLRRLVMVTGDKGGVGKSTFARGLAQTYIDNAVKFVGLDADNSNPHLIRFYGKHADIAPLDISNSDKLDEFLDNLKQIVYPKSKGDGKIRQEQSLILLETPSQFLPTLETLIKEMGFLGVVNDKCKMQVTIVVVISTIIDCINQLSELHSFCGNNVDYVIVKNLFYGEAEQFTFYDNSKEVKEMSKQVKAKGHKFININMPKLAKKSYDYLDVNNLTFRQALEQDEYPSVYGRVLSWLKNLKEQIKPIKTLFGIKEILSE